MLNLLIDGGARGNPGIGGARPQIFLGHSPAVELRWGTIFLGEEVINNVAEYEGLILGLRAAVELFGRRHFYFRIGGDNQLFLSQVTEEMACRALNLQVPYRRALELRDKLATAPANFKQSRPASTARGSRKGHRQAATSVHRASRKCRPTSPCWHP